MPAERLFTCIVHFRDGNALPVTANITQVCTLDADNKGTGTTPDEIVAAMIYLFSEGASKISGASRIPLYQ